MKTLKYSQDLIETTNTLIECGFDMFIMGHDSPKFSDYGDKNECYSRIQGYNFAKKMAEDNGIAFTNKFKCKCGGYPFLYGGFWVCNSCGSKNVNEEWWGIQVEKDGNEFCCHGLDFVNLQESNNYAFGSTFIDAINNYEEAMNENKTY